MSRKPTGPKEAEARAQREAKATAPTPATKAETPKPTEKKGNDKAAAPPVEDVTGKPPKADSNGHDLFEAMLQKIEKEHVGKVIKNKRGYASVQAQGRTAAYVVPGKKGLRVEVIVPVKDEATFAAAFSALEVTTK